MNKLPLIVSYGVGTDSSAMLIGLHHLGIRPDLIIFADTGSERLQTMQYIPTMNQWLKSVGFPTITIVSYKPKDFKHFPPYGSLYENSLTNATLPSLAFGGRKNCSLKWKVAPINSYVERWQPALDTWAAGNKVTKYIGYDASPADIKRLKHIDGKRANISTGGAGTMAADLARDAKRYDTQYPLIEWGWTRAKCIQVIEAAGLPQPGKSSCFFCPAMKTHEVDALRPEELRKIIVMEARAWHRLRGNWSKEKVHAFNVAAYKAWANFNKPTYQTWLTLTTPARRRKNFEDWTPEEIKTAPKPLIHGIGCGGLWNRGVKGTRGAIPKPASMTAYIRANNLLPTEELDRIVSETPQALCSHLGEWESALEEMNRHDVTEQLEDWESFLEKFFNESETKAEVTQLCLL